MSGDESGAGITLSAIVPLELIREIVRDEVERLVREQQSRWLNADDAAAYLACKRRRIYELVSERKVEFRKDGSRLLFRREWLDTVAQEAR